MHALRLPLALILLTGCGAEATITRRDGWQTSGVIEGGDATHIHLVTERGEVVHVERALIDDIDHPGNVMMAAGGVLTAAGGLMVAGGLHDGSSDGRVLLLISPLYLVPGIVLLTSGFSKWNTSTQASAPPSAEPALTLAPGGLRGRF